MKEPLKILIVDDEEMVRLNLETFLEDAGFELLTAANGKAAVRTVLENKDIDVGVIDMRLPDTDGQSLIIELSQLAPEMQYIIHTGSLDYELTDELSCLGIAANQVCHKPIPDMDSFIQMINELVTARQ